MERTIYKILVTTTFKEPGGKDFGMNTVVVEYDSKMFAEKAFEILNENGGVAKNAVYVTAIRLY